MIFFFLRNMCALQWRPSRPCRRDTFLRDMLLFLPGFRGHFAGILAYSFDSNVGCSVAVVVVCELLLVTGAHLVPQEGL